MYKLGTHCFHPGNLRDTQKSMPDMLWCGCDFSVNGLCREASSNMQHAEELSAKNVQNQYILAEVDRSLREHHTP